MPHKHKRKHAASVSDGRKGGEDDEFDLPPTKRARPLSVHKPKPETWDGFDAGAATGTSEKANKRRKAQKESTQTVKDDTPKNFARLMAWQSQGRKLRKGLDDGERRKEIEKKTGTGKKVGKRKERDIVDAMAESVKDIKRLEGLPSVTMGQVGETEKTTERVQDAAPSTTTPDSATPAQNANEKLKIKPGERLSDFALRVDQSLPLSNVPKHGTKDKVLGLKQKLTKHNRNLQRMQSEWRNAEKKIKSRKEEEEDEVADQKEENQLLWMDVNSANANRKGKKRRKAGDVEDADPWRALEKKRRDAGQGTSTAGLRASDTVQAPPVLKPIKNMFRETQERRAMKV